METLLVLALFCYFLGMIKYFLHIAFRRKALYYLATGITITGFVFHTAMLFAISIKSGHGPYSTPFEYTSFFAWTVMGAMIIAILVFRVTSLGMFLSPIGFLIMAHSFLLPRAAVPTIPIKAFWLTMHNTVSFLAFSSFAVLFAASVMYLIQERQLKSHNAGVWLKRMPDLDTLDTLFSRSLLFGFPLITVGVGAGLIWSFSNSGSLFGNNPAKNIPMFLVWLLFAVLMVTRSIFGLRGHKIAMFGLAAFTMAVIALGIHLH